VSVNYLLTSPTPIGTNPPPTLGCVVLKIAFQQ
jgi:hypothetical protein